LNLPGTSANFNLRSSEFLLFTNKPLPKPESGIVQEDFITAIPKEIITEGVFKIYPVPTEGRLIVEFPAEMNGANFRIIDMTGRVLFAGTSASGTKILELDLREIHAGIYIFEVYDNKRVLRQRFIKK
jgi:Secretion system C-terminal sorting domain